MLIVLIYIFKNFFYMTSGDNEFTNILNKTCLQYSNMD